MLQEIRASLSILILFTLITGIAYPLAMTGIGQALFPHQAMGSLVQHGGTIIGSELIGQNFTGARYFHSRPSAAGNSYDAGNSSGSNLAPTSPDLLKTITERVAEWRKNDDKRPIPVDLVTSSGSGLDPDISVASATYQATDIAAARGLPIQQVTGLITQNTTPPALGFIGQHRVNVLALNRALDRLTMRAP